ncbi:MAG: DUF362 domain-containing protein [Defluviitaleaceae bacterium]|nr:DUF362 domain-containing protein [Defluviitaleaceae bacterium]
MKEPPKEQLSLVGFSRNTADPTDKEVCDMIDEVIFQTLGLGGLRRIIKPGDKVVIKVNLVGPYMGERGEKGRAIITDPRVARYVAELVREIIGFNNGASLKLVDAVMYPYHDPSMKAMRSSFHWAKLERTGDNAVDPEDFCYDFDADGILDGKSLAELVNLDSLGAEDRQLFKVPMKSGNVVSVSFPKFLRTKEQAEKTSSPNEYTDVFIGLPVFKSHSIEGITGALKLHYGLRSRYGMPGDPGRFGHNGMYYDEKGNHNVGMLTEYLLAQHKVRSYDYAITDCITANRKGPTLPEGGISYLPTKDQKTDYIITSAMIASLDPVALDTAHAALAGYELSSIPILEPAHEEGLGQCRPSHIVIADDEYFTLHRRFLWDLYKGCPRRYPLENGWGGAKALTTVTPGYTVFAAVPQKISKHKYKIYYLIIRNKEQKPRGIVRAELTIGSGVVDFKTQGNLESGSFILDLDKYPEFLNTDIAYNILVWDDTFNCVSSIERFIFA